VRRCGGVPEARGGGLGKNTIVIKKQDEEKQKKPYSSVGSMRKESDLG
jgi:hypothetical protein